MAGHSKWANIRHRKWTEDSKRNRIFTKLMREITIATKIGGTGDVNSNPRLRSAMLKARVENMPRDNIEKAIKKGLGGNNGDNYEEILYEAYVNRVALMISVLTDNKNRSASDIRSVLTKNGGVLGTVGSASRLFERKGILFLPAKVGEDLVIEAALEAGAEDVTVDEDTICVITDTRGFIKVLENLQVKGLEILRASTEFMPIFKEILDTESARKVIDIVEKLEDLDDVHSVEHNLDISKSLEG